ncbi:ExbD/TolR family protein [Ferruginibacter sp.]|nr:biopolymer transporter ExbD [Ferruginibacter sp.]
MAAFETVTAAKHQSGKRVNKKSTRVDLTPMVDLGFLLITFFVFTSSMTKPKIMGIITPKDSNIPTLLCESCVITAVLAKDDRIIYYEGIQKDNTIIKETTFTAEGLRAVLLQKKAAVKIARGSEDEMVLIVKPTDESSYKNFVDILDEVAINGIKHYFIDELNNEDKQLLKK